MQSALLAFWQVLFLCRKELLAIFKDPASRIILFGPVFMQALLFGYGATFNITHVPYAVLDQNSSPETRQIIANLEGSGLFQRVATLRSADDIAPLINAGKALVVISFAPDFDRRLQSGQSAPIQVIVDGRNSSTAALASAYVSESVATFNQSRSAAATITIHQRAWFNTNLESRWTIMSGLIAALSMLQTLLLSALSVAREREQGTFDQLLVTPLTPMQILIGKALPSMMVGMMQSTIILLLVLFWFDVPVQGSLGLLYLGLFAFTGASVGIGLSISALSLTMQQAMLYTFMLVMPLMLLSGLVTPVRNMPEVLQWATYANPLRFGIDLVRRVYLEGATLGDVAHNFVPLLAVAGITLPLAAWLFRHRLA